ncbi:HAD-IA family hydrolase [Thalassotalea fonticola]|uniref:HAD-IA family hydrolase n=1 Tax=Thalassotalea fonticola TaxID=3065649 RepID=A0ABZ0GU77_9GAMM|nr:HAD-IA family hydrolase [Colwelliaceae bacterium S1-1]
MNQYQLYIFDWDGTLMNSINKIVHSLQAAAQAVNLPIPDESASKGIIGASLTQASKILFPGIEQIKIDELIKHYKQQYLEINATPSPLYEDAEQLLLTLHAKEKLLAVATGKGRQGLERVLAVSNTKHLFHLTKSSDDAKSKPHPEMLEQILLELDVKPEHALMIGDSRYDLKMAEHAGVDSIGITHGAGCISSLTECNPKAIVHSIKELAALIL